MTDERKKLLEESNDICDKFSEIAHKFKDLCGKLSKENKKLSEENKLARDEIRDAISKNKKIAFDLSLAVCLFTSLTIASIVLTH